jgi:hypothetical protein
MLDNPNPTVAYRHRFGKRLTYTDKEIVCALCAQPDDRRIVLRSENGQRVKTGQIKCAVCTKPIKVVS